MCFGKVRKMFETLSLWLHETLCGKMLLTFLISMLPVVELRGGLPAGVALGLPIPLAFFLSLLGNMLPVPFIILFARSLFRWIRVHIPALGNAVTKLESHAVSRGKKVKKYEVWGLLLFVAVPFPGTGAWTGALIAAVMNMRIRRAVPVIFVGVVIAGIIMTILTYGVTTLL